MKIWVLVTLGRMDRGEPVLLRVEHAFATEAAARERLAVLAQNFWEKHEGADYFCVRGVYETTLAGDFQGPAPVLHPGQVWIEANMSRLPRGQWVAADADGLVATSDSHDGLTALLQKRGVAPDTVATAFTDP